LLNAAGFVHHGTVLDCSDDDWDFSFDLNVKSMHRTLRAFLPGMLEAGRGSIVNISSAAGVFKAAPNRYVYGATKAAVAALTRAVAAMAKRVGKIDILLNAAGFVHHGTVLDCSDDDWDFSFDINEKSMHRTLRAFLPGMLESGHGSIVNIASAAGVFKAAPNRYVYGATKAAVAALTRAVAADFITRGIRCNCICPGTIETPSMLDRAAAAGPQGREMFVSRQPMGRLGTADEIASLAIYLASDESSFTTGVAHIIDGGWTL
ncbi:MAG: short-chain dehydrogenase/reductase, partial [Tardiphaga sp.]|nr:short-chain dehydrogenase/reductase [Tardiphaga sp.]